MSKNSQIPFKLFQIDRGPFSYPSYAICAAFRNEGGYLKSETFVLIQTSPEKAFAYGSKFSYTKQVDADIPIQFDESFAMDEAKRQAETQYSVRACEISPKYLEQSGWHRPNLIEVPQHQLFALWAHTSLGDQLLRIADYTDCTALQQYLYALRKVPKVKYTPIPL